MSSNAQRLSFNTFNINQISGKTDNSQQNSYKKSKNKRKKRRDSQNGVKVDKNLSLSSISDNYCKDSEEVVVNEEERDIEEELLLIENKEKKDCKIKFQFCGSITEKTKSPLYGVQFNHYLPEDKNYFATVGGNKATVYECLSNGSNRLVQCYSDPDNEEDLYTCVWSYDSISGKPLLITAGVRAVIRVINCALNECVKHLTGHGSAVNDLKISPYNCNLLLSSSKDYSLRLWNIKTSVCIAKFCGDSGHRDQVISADFHIVSNKYIISAGMDHSIKIWSIDKQNIANAIKESEDYSGEQSFATQTEHFPCFTNRDIHNNYVDCVQFFGNFVFSKSMDNKMICWKPNQLNKESNYSFNKSMEINNEFTLIDKFPLKDCNVWFVKFSMNANQSMLSCGNSLGVTYVWDTYGDNPFDYKAVQLIHPNCKSIVRQTSFSSDGSILVCICEDSTIWRWNLAHT